MATVILSGKELRKLGFPEGKAIGLALEVMETHYKGKSKKAKLELLKRVVENPALYAKHEALGPIANGLLIRKMGEERVELLSNRIPYAGYGADGIEPGAINQMEIAMKLPVT